MMLYIAYISFLFVGIQLLNVLLNYIFEHSIVGVTTINEGEKISILIPARNEEKNIGSLLSDLRNIDNNNIEILVYNDQSTDRTAAIVKEKSENDSRIILINGQALPFGWQGKNFACHQLAQQASGNKYLFLDADVRIYGQVITDAVAYQNRYKLALLSVFPIQIQMSVYEKFTVPIMNYILLTLLPLIFVRISPFQSHSAANGQFMLFDAVVYKRLQPHLLFKMSIVEDISIAHFLKKQNLKIGCITGDNRIQCRMYHTFGEALNGFSKNVFMFFGNNPILAMFFLCITSLGFVPVLLTLRDYLPLYIAAIILIQFFYALTSKQNIVHTILMFPFHLLFLFMVMVNAIYSKMQKKHTWKERNIYS
ncbi:MAG: glycosyltransferase [Marinilabiliaceae bacterium]|nr:glycosyltransferase [Marinilabiliaceae bacterium]